MQTMSALQADTYFNVWRNTSDQQLPITWRMSMERILRLSKEFQDYEEMSE